MTEPLLAPQANDALRETLTEHGYTRDGIVARIGREAARALDVYDPEPAFALLGEDDPLAVLIRLFMLGRPVPLAVVEQGMVPLLEPAGNGVVRAAVCVYPYEQWWAVSDFPRFLRPAPHDQPADRVLPIGPTAASVRRAMPAGQVESALDLGTGSGVLALHLSERARRVTATDLAPRAARFAATTAALNGLDWEILVGDMAEPVAGRRFDLVVSNPPYVVGPGQVHCMYRDSGRAGDAVCAELAGAAGRLLNEGGMLQFRANWAHIAGEDWRERVRGWIPAGGEKGGGDGCGFDGWAVQAFATEVGAYVEHWLEQSGGEEVPGQREAWLRWFEERKIEAVGTGTVVLRRSGRADPVVRVEELAPDAGELTGAQVSDWFVRQDWLRDHDLLTARFAPGDGVALWQAAEHLGGRGADGAAGAEGAAARGGSGWRLTQQVLKIPARGLNWSDAASPLAVALVGGAGRDAPLGEQLGRLARAEGLGEAESDRLVEAALGEVRRLVERGALVPQGPSV